MQEGKATGPALFIPAQGRRAPRVKSQPQAGPAGTRSALDAWEYRPVPAAAISRPKHGYARTSEESPSRIRSCCDDRQNPPFGLWATRMTVQYPFCR